MAYLFERSEPQLFRPAEVRRLLGLTQRQLIYWQANGILRQATPSRNKQLRRAKGRPRGSRVALFSLDDVFVLAVVRDLLSHSVTASLELARDVIAELRGHHKEKTGQFLGLLSSFFRPPTVVIIFEARDAHEILIRPVEDAWERVKDLTEVSPLVTILHVTNIALAVSHLENLLASFSLIHRHQLLEEVKDEDLKYRIPRPGHLT